MPDYEHLNLVQQINGIEFEEYPTVAAAWMKVASIGELRECVSEDLDLDLLDRFERGEGCNIEIQRELIRIFLREWLSFNVPENIGVWGLDIEEFQSVNRHAALESANQIVAACRPDAFPDEQSPHAQSRLLLASIRGRGRDGAGADPPADQLLTWFADHLFSQPEAVFFVHDSPGGQTVRFNLANPRVVGIASNTVGMLWLE